MENFALISSTFPVPVGTLTRLRRVGPNNRRVSCGLLRTSKAAANIETLATHSFENSSPSTITSTSTSVARTPSYIISPILWIGVGVGLSALFSVVATKLKRRAILRAFQAVMGQDAPRDGEFGTAAFSTGSSFPLPDSSPLPSVTTLQSSVSSQLDDEKDSVSTKMEECSPTDINLKTEEVTEASSLCS